MSAFTERSAIKNHDLLAALSAICPVFKRSYGTARHRTRPESSSIVHSFGNSGFRAILPIVNHDDPHPYRNRWQILTSFSLPDSLGHPTSEPTRAQLMAPVFHHIDLCASPATPIIKLGSNREYSFPPGVYLTISVMAPDRNNNYSRASVKGLVWEGP